MLSVGMFGVVCMNILPSMILLRSAVTVAVAAGVLMHQYTTINKQLPPMILLKSGAPDFLPSLPPPPTTTTTTTNQQQQQQ